MKLTIFFMTLAFAGLAHATDICSKDICAHLTLPATGLHTEDTMDFLVDFNADVGKPEVMLEMDMGGGMVHHSAPVRVSEISTRQFHVEDAQFVMVGTWLVQLKFTVNNTPYEIDIPVEVKD